MPNYKKFLLNLLVGGIGGFLAVSLFLPVLVKHSLFGTASIFDKSVYNYQTALPKVEEAPALWPIRYSYAIEKIEPQVVAIQSFSGGTLVRYGSGMILTQDGLIATLNSLVPSGASLIQVTNGNKIYSSKVIFRNYSKNIAIISIADEALPTVKFNYKFTLGQDILVFAKTVSPANDSALVSEAIISQINPSKGQFKINITFSPPMYGSAVIDDQANVLGLIDFRDQKSVVIDSRSIAETLSSALTKTN